MTTNTNTQTPCALGVSGRTLSDFRSDGLDPKEMERLRAHVAQCPACQARLAEYETLAQRLRGQSEPNGHAQLWQNVRASIAATETPTAVRSARQARGAGHSHSTQTWAALGSIAAVLALSVGFVALFVSRGGWPAFGTHGQATPIVIHAGSLTWRQVIVPKGFPGVDQYGETQSLTYDGPYIAQSDGNTAYACQANSKRVTSPVVWGTHDAGAHWSVITPSGLPANADGCRLTVDANAANTLIVSFFKMSGPGTPPPPGQWTTYASFDGGATWTKPAGVNDGSIIYQLTSARGQVYATRTTYTSDGNAHTMFSVSTDQMQRWSAIDASLPETQPNPPDVHDTGKVFQIWVNPATSEALERTYAGSLWSTRDDGAHWTKIAYPGGVYTDSAHGPQLTGALIPNDSLTICGAFTPIGTDSDSRLECTTDDGKTWIRRPDLITDGKGGGANVNVAGIGADGAVYATKIVVPATPNAKNQDELLYRLPADAASTSDWQRLGQIPQSEYGAGLQVAPASGRTVIWLFPGITTTSDSSGSKTYTQPYYYVATYP